MRTRAVSVKEARDPVLATTELLENILLLLPVHDIVQARLVCKRWKQVVGSSPQICRKLFVFPDASKQSWRYDSTATDFVLREVDEKNLIAQANATATQPTLVIWKKSQWPMKAVTLNPMLFAHEPEHKRGTAKGRAYLCETIRFKARPDLASVSRRSVYNAMFLCQPPVQYATVTIAYHIAKNSPGRIQYPLQHVRFSVESARGVTLGHVLRKFLQVVPVAFDDRASFPLQDYRIEVRGNGGSALWVPGAVFVGEEERKVMASRLPVGRPSSLVREMTSRESSELGPERWYSWWSKEDHEWAVADEKWMREADGTKAPSYAQ